MKGLFKNNFLNLKREKEKKVKLFKPRFFWLLKPNRTVETVKSLSRGFAVRFGSNRIVADCYMQSRTLTRISIVSFSQSQFQDPVGVSNSIFQLIDPTIGEILEFTSVLHKVKTNILENEGKTNFRDLHGLIKFFLPQECNNEFLIYSKWYFWDFIYISIVV